MSCCSVGRGEKGGVTVWSFRSSELAFSVVRRELCDQDALYGSQNWPDGTGLHRADRALADQARQECDMAIASGRGSWRLLVAEEIAEAFAETDEDRLLLEIPQAMGLLAQWLEALLLRRAGLLPHPPAGHQDLALISSVQRAVEATSCR